MFGLFVLSFIITCVQLIKESFEKPIPAENWANSELYFKDMTDGVSNKQLMKNLENGKYKLVEAYPEPHRDLNGKIVIENSLLHKQDIRAYGAYQTHQWVEQGKYNLSPKELENEEQRVKEKIEYMYSLL